MSAPELAGEAKRAAALDQLARDSLGWLRTGVPGASQALPRDLRRDARRARGLHQAAERPVAVAVFGASQAGKSYLVSRLAAPLGKPLTAALGAARLDFLKEINPEGGQESTGLVTRFTIAPPSTPAEAPILLRLLSQTDVVKIIANTYLEDFKVDDIEPMSPEAQREHLDRLEGMAGPAACDALEVDDVEDLQDYFRAHFRDRAQVTALSAGFWQRLAEIVPRLPVERRAEAFAPLWGKQAGLGACCAGLLGVLKRLGFPAEVHAGLDAIQPRETSIIDVRTLFTMGVTSTGEVGLRNSRGGAQVMVDRALATALVTEIVVPLAERPWAFMDHTDLLDFPGARTREQIPNADAFLAVAGNLGRAFLRGKVAYLFQRYNAEQEISAMLLCVGPSNQDVQTLPGMVNEWIGLTAGRTPEERAGKASNLFFVLTKFDAEFEVKAGEDIESGQRWTARMQASLLDFFGKAYEWPAKWTPDGAFNNMFWLRNPSIGFGAVFDYDPQTKLEAGIADRAREGVTARRTAYLGNDLVRRHFADPALAWDEALRANDGGIGHLAAAIAPVCDPKLKARQLKARAVTLAGDITTRLRPFYRGGDADQRIAEAQRRGRTIGRALAQCAQGQMLGPFLRALMVDTDGVAAVYWRLQSDETTGATPIGTAASADDIMGLLGDLLGDEPAATPEAAAGDVPRDAFDHFAKLALGDWEARMRALVDDEELVASFLMPREVILEIVGELAQAARRTRQREKIAEALRRRASFLGHADAMEAKQVAIVEEMLNAFVHQLGYGDGAEAQRPRIGREDRPIFKPRTPDPAPPPLPEQPSAYDMVFNADWIGGIMAVMEGNARSMDGVDYDVAANALLGEILGGLAATREGA